ncbi:MAG: DUF6265 family protein [Saprospiraceae bacterium]|nr:DUF6265 family protein [Saprospiraceae bacterium]
MKKTIADLFKENEQKLNEKPSPQAWRRLERRLDERRQYSKVSVFRQLGSIAALIALGGFVTLLALLFEPSKKATFAAENYNPEPLEDSNTGTSGNKIVEFIHQYQDRLSKPIAEGGIGRRIMLSGKVERVLNSQFRVSMSDFKWLEGEWKQDINGRQARESWEVADNQGLKGQGFLIESNGEYTYLDPMRIYIAGGKLYFETVFESKQQPVRYTLRHFFADKIIFENKEVEFPQQVIFEIQSPNMYSIIFQNEAYLDMNDAAATYLSQRNTIVPQRILRILERVE